jgi:hypothetical protein
MVAAEAFVAKLLLDTAISSAVDVVSKRATNPTVRAAGRAYKVYSVCSAATSVYDAYRIASYSEVAGVLAREVVVEGLSRQVAKALIGHSGVNFEVHRMAEQYLIKGDFDVDNEPNVRRFVGWSYYDSDLMSADFHSHGRALAERISLRLDRAVEAANIATDLATKPEAKERRRRF